MDHIKKVDSQLKNAMDEVSLESNGIAKFDDSHFDNDGAGVPRNQLRKALEEVKSTDSKSSNFDDSHFDNDGAGVP